MDPVDTATERERFQILGSRFSGPASTVAEAYRQVAEVLARSSALDDEVLQDELRQLALDAEARGL